MGIYISPMPRSAYSVLVVFSILGLAACSKKQEPTPTAAPPPEPPATTTEAIPPPREFDFSGKSSNTGPSSPDASVKPGQPEPAPQSMQVQMPVLVEYYPPFYPFSDRMKGTEGRLQVGLFVTETGTVEGATIISSSMPAYRDDVLKAAASWRFIPAVHEGKPIRFPVQIPVSFVSEFGSGGMPPGSPLERLMLSGDTYYMIQSDGKYVPANLEVTPLTRVEPAFVVPEGVDELRVALRFHVDEQGRVVNPEIAESSKSEFDQAALKAIQFWQFIPKLKNGKPVKALAQLPLKISRN